VMYDIDFHAPTEEFKRVSMIATKDERVRALKQMLDTNNTMRGPGSEHNMLIMSGDSSPLPLSLVSTPKQRSRI